MKYIIATYSNEESSFDPVEIASYARILSAEKQPGSFYKNDREAQRVLGDLCRTGVGVFARILRRVAVKNGMRKPRSKADTNAQYVPGFR